jgi:phosphatidylglycerophosphate synthase
MCQTPIWAPPLHSQRHTAVCKMCAPPLQLEMATAFGAFLDPVADKLMVSTALILLAAGPPAPVGSAAMAVPALVVIGREIAMSSLREWAASSGGGASKVQAY